MIYRWVPARLLFDRMNWQAGALVGQLAMRPALLHLHRAENSSIKHATGNGGAEALGETPAPKRVHLQLRTAAMHNGRVAFDR